MPNTIFGSSRIIWHFFHAEHFKNLDFLSFLAPCQDNRLRGQEGGETSFLVPWQLQTFCPHPEWQQWEAASSEEAGIHHNSHIYPLGNGYWVVWEDMPKKKHFSFVHWKKGQWAWFLVIIIIIKIIIIIAIKGQIGKTIWLPIPYRKASHFFRSFLLPPLTPERQRNEKTSSRGHSPKNINRTKPFTFYHSSPVLFVPRSS